MKEFRILQNCSVCGEGFDSDYKLAKHMSSIHPPPERVGRTDGEDSCSCGGSHSHVQGHC
ncbi:MAG TPA: hypothetical protein VJL54_03900 [Nitrososphaera sp.]|nr:hypothetical protein [Nitrososphaera sp.]